MDHVKRGRQKELEEQEQGIFCEINSQKYQRGSSTWLPKRDFNNNDINGHANMEGEKFVGNNTRQDCRQRGRAKSRRNAILQ